MTAAIDRTKGDQSTPGNIIRGEGYALIRNSEATPDPDKVIHIPCADSFSVIVQLRDFNSHRLWNGNKLVFDGGHPRKSISIAYLGDEIKCQHRTTYDNVRFMLPRASIKEFLYEEGQRASAEPERIIGVDDPVVYHLALALLPSFARAGERNELFIEQVMLALLTHVQDRFASTQVPVCTGKGLAPWQLRRAKELIAGHLAEGVSVARLAEECGLAQLFHQGLQVQHRCFAPRMADAHARRPGQGADAGQRRTAFADRRRLRLFRPAAFLADLSPAGRRLALDLASGQAAAHRRSAVNRDRA